MVRVEQVVQTALMVLRVLRLYQVQVARQVRVAQMPPTARQEFLVKATRQVLMVLLAHQEREEQMARQVLME
jgi:hypothetical protein